MSPLTQACPGEKQESKSGEVLRTPSASFRIEVKETMARAGGAMQLPASDGEHYVSHSWALSPLSHRPEPEASQDQSAHLQHDPSV